MLTPSHPEASVHSISIGRTLRRGILVLLILVGSASPVFAQSGASAGGAQSEAGRHVLLSVPHEVDGQPVIAIEIDVAGPAEVGHTPDGWDFEMTDGGIRLSGAPLDENNGRFRLDIPDEVMWDGARFRLMGPDGELSVGFVEPPSEYPELVVHSATGSFLRAPDQAAAGEVVRLEITDELLVGVGMWKLEGVRILAVGDTEFLSGRIPGALIPGDFAGITYEDAFGLEMISDGEAIEITGSSEDEDREAALTGCTPRVFRGRSACICGYFPTSEIQGGLMLDGQPLGVPGAASSEVVYVEIPEGTAPGSHTITANGIEGSIEILVLAARGEIDLTQIEQGGSTPLRVIVEGTDEPLQLILRNLEPTVIELEGGVEQEVETTGGGVNSFERIVTGLAPGAFDVFYELAQDPCPCLESEDVNIAENDVGGTRTRDPEPDSTRTRPPWWPEDPDDDDPRDVPIPPVYGEEIDEDEEPGCCGFRGPLLVWPQTTDPLAQSDPMLAPHAPAVGGVQVHLASGAYFQNDRDLSEETLGIPFDLLRHYTSDVETLSGGFMGHRWDFSYNKRLVALGRDYAEGLRGQQVGAEQSVVMYFDGMGRGLRYVEQSSDWRNVNNFGSDMQVRAYVTTYVSPDGEFNELQRYVLEDATKHPFAGHRDIDQGEAIFFVMREKNGVRYVYNCRGQLLHILGRNDFASLPAGASSEPVRYTFEYRGPRNPLTQSSTLSKITDPSGRDYYISTKDIDQALVNTNDDCFHLTGTFPIPRVRKISGPGIEITYKYADGDSSPILETVRRVFSVVGSDSVVTETKYAYDGEQRMISVIAPQQMVGDKTPYIRNTYDGAGRVEKQWLGGSPHSTFLYSGNSVSVTNAAGPKKTYSLLRIGEYRVVQSETVSGPSGSWTTAYAHNTSTQVTSTTMPRGNKIVFLYDESNEAVTKGPMRNDVEAGVTYHNNLSLGNLIGIRRERGTLPPGDGANSIASATEHEPLYNQASKVTDANGNSTTFRYEYDDQGLLGNPVEESPPDLTQPDGTVVTIFPRAFSYTNNGLVESEAATPFDVANYEYNKEGLLTSIKSPHGNQSFNLDFYGRVRGWTGPDGTITYKRDSRGLTIEESVSSPGSKKTFKYDLNGNLIEETRFVSDNYGSRERLVGSLVAPQRGASFQRTTTTTRDVIGRPLSEKTVAGDLTREVSRAFDAAGRITKTEEPSPTGGAFTTAFQHDARGNVVTEKRGSLEIRKSYDANGNLVSEETGPSGAARTQAYTYDVFDRATSETDPAGSVATRRFDANGNVLAEEIRGENGDEQSSVATLAKTESTFNEHDLVATRTSYVLDSGQTTHKEQFFYNRIAKLTRQVALGDVTTQYGYDEPGRLKEMLDPVGNKTVYEYGDFDRKSSVTQVEVERSYEPVSRKWTEEVKEYKTTMTYDEVGRVLTTSSPEAVTAYRYSSDGLRRVAALQGVGITETVYDGLGRQSKVITAGQEQTFKYTAAGQIAEMQSANRHQRWKYDDQGNSVENEDVLTGAKTVIKRDAIGNPEAITDANGTTTRRTFNALGLPLVDRIQPGTGMKQRGELKLLTVGGSVVVWRRYDGLGRLRYAQNGRYMTIRDTGVSLFYDGLNRIIREEQSRDNYGQTLERSYAADDSWMETRYPELAGSDKVRRHYDNLGRVIRVDLEGEMVASYAYSGSDRIAGYSLRNGTVAVHKYDAKRRMTDTRVWSEAGSYYDNPAVIYSARASYTPEGRLSETLAVDQARSSSTTTRFKYDGQGRTIESLSTTSVGGKTPNQTVSRLLTTYAGNRPAVQAELLTQTQGEFPVAQFARIQEFTYNGAQVAAVKTSARDKFDGRVPTIESVADLSGWIAGDGLFIDTQKFEYDAVGNVIADDANLYQYDSERRLTMVSQIPGNRPYNQITSFNYDPLGRRVSTFPSKDRTPRGFVNFDPWTRTPSWFVYDGQTAIAEGTGSGSGTLIARYIAGSRPGERIRMDRRTNDARDGAFKPYYLHTNMQGQVAFLTDGEGTSISTASPSANLAGAAFAPPDDERFIAGSTTRSPYLSGSIRIDGFSGIKYDEQSRRTIYDYRTSPRVAQALNMAAYRQSITAMQNRGGIALAVMSGAVLAPGAAVLEGLINVGLNWTAAAWTASPYTPSEAGEHLAQGAMSAGLGKLIPGGSTAMQRFWSSYASDVTSGVAFDVGLHNKSWSDAISKNAISAFASAGIGSGIRGGIAGIGIGFKAVSARMKSSRTGSTEGFANQVGGAADAPYQPRATSEVFSTMVRGRGNNRDIALQNETMSLLLNGGPYHKHIARQIMRGELTVHWDLNLPQKYGGLWHPSTPTAIYLNPWSFSSRPSSALSLASVIVHEATHAMGGGELSSHIAQAQFIYGWWAGRGKKTTSFGSQRLQYTLAHSDIQVTRAWQNTQSSNNVAWMNQYLHAANYAPDKAFFIRAQHLNKLHLPIARAGGWGTVLNLHPALDYKLFRFARSNNGVNY